MFQTANQLVFFMVHIFSVRNVTNTGAWVLCPTFAGRSSVVKKHVTELLPSSLLVRMGLGFSSCFTGCSK